MGVRKKSAPSKEEGPFFGVKQGEAAVDLELGDVGLDLGEVGVGGGVQDEVGRDAPFGRQAGVGLGVSSLQGAGRIFGHVHGVGPAAG
jgi:hypothetical protein